MPNSSSSRVPSYRRHKPTNQAVVTINGQDIYLGKWNTAASKAEYDRLIAEFLANGRRLQSDADRTVVEVLNAYRKFAENYYRKGGRVTSEYGVVPRTSAICARATWTCRAMSGCTGRRCLASGDRRVATRRLRNFDSR